MRKISLYVLETVFSFCLLMLVACQHQNEEDLVSSLNERIQSWQDEGQQVFSEGAVKVVVFDSDTSIWGPIADKELAYSMVGNVSAGFSAEDMKKIRFSSNDGGGVVLTLPHCRVLGRPSIPDSTIVNEYEHTRFPIFNYTAQERHQIILKGEKRIQSFVAENRQTFVSEAEEGARLFYSLLLKELGFEESKCRIEFKD